MHSSLYQFKSGYLQALSHPTRIAILEFLNQGELSAGALIEKLEMGQAKVSQHLAIFAGKAARLKPKAGNQVFYSVRAPLIHDV